MLLTRCARADLLRLAFIHARFSIQQVAMRVRALPAPAVFPPAASLSSSSRDAPEFFAPFISISSEESSPCTLPFASPQPTGSICPTAGSDRGGAGRLRWASGDRLATLTSPADAPALRAGPIIVPRRFISANGTAPGLVRASGGIGPTAVEAITRGGSAHERASGIRPRRPLASRGAIPRAPPYSALGLGPRSARPGCRIVALRMRTCAWRDRPVIEVVGDDMTEQRIFVAVLTRGGGGRALVQGSSSLGLRIQPCPRATIGR